MKKVLFVALVGALVACGETSTEAEVTTDTTPAAAVEATLDSAAAAIDTAASKVDSAANAIVDSAK